MGFMDFEARWGHRDPSSLLWIASRFISAAVERDEYWLQDWKAGQLQMTLTNGEAVVAWHPYSQTCPARESRLL